MKVAVFQTVFLYQVPEGFRQFRVEHIDPGDIDGNGNCMAQGIFPAPDLCRGFPPDIVVKVTNQAVVLKQRDKNARTDHAKLRMLPADQCFRAAEHRRFRPDIILRLEEDGKLFLCQRFLEIIQQAFCIYFLLMKGVVVDSDGNGETVPDGVRCAFGKVKATLHINAFIHPGVYADAGPYASLQSFAGGGGDLLGE